MPPSSPIQRWAAPGDWSLVRSHITRLYVDEGRKLEDVMAILATEYGHRGTLKMYKARIAKWGLRKYKKEDDMLFILHKTYERGITGKKTTFVVRGREMTLEEVFRYFTKRGGVPARKEGGFQRPSTPAHISYSTPPPEAPDSSTLAASTPVQDASPSKFDHSIGRPGTFMAQDLPEGYSLSYVKAEDVPRLFFSSSPGVSSPPSPPQTLLISEELLFSIKAYFYGSFQSGTWISDDVNGCINIKVGESKLQNMSIFMDSCESAARSMQARNYVDARIMLSSACKVVKGILEDEDPRSLDILLEGLLFLKKEHHLDQVVDIMRRYIGAMATVVFANTPEYPWRNIWRLLSVVEADQIEATIDQAWRCASDAFQENLGIFHTSSLVCYLEYIRYGCMSPEDEEHALLQLLRECQHFPENFTPMTNILYSLANNLRRQKRHAEQEVYASQLLALAREKNSFDELLWGLGSLSLAQRNLGKKEKAERHLRESIALSSKKRGPSAPQAINSWMKLEGWIRDWGEEERADQVRKEYEKLIKQLDVSEEDPGVFGSDKI